MGKTDDAARERLDKFLPLGATRRYCVTTVGVDINCRMIKAHKNSS